ncbi:glucose-1-phosphate adenylyltransferase [Fervidibacillus albus]|uniref:Glucose-1-phosphate adenylyltransferase n=1 Tax=Fervidibacillus albus TaxID=2980026 RepID=A0A9E8LSF4_9BACI|nr:glucose-1-phosphate adenylyltransferase [Fervidibacillus albus]WAA08540.1 glucose-1-phosphate adenylyltransferase [Fervidibacillus albus]
MGNECVAMLLAGGEGKRLGALTTNIAKPAVPFGGKYRIIDFTLSNCANSGIRTVGVLTQYSPHELHRHIGNGKPWDMNREKGGITILPPFTAKHGGEWYTGTADAIYQNIHFVNQYNPKYVLVISGDHIYQMNYEKLLEQHKQTNAEVTISVIEVPIEEAHRFGILNTTDNMQIYEFEEKPKNPKNNLASMGIYVFNWDVLKNYLIKDAMKKTSSHDFGKDVIPAMLMDGRRMFAYRFSGYWKDVGTVSSYWEANMDLLEDEYDDLVNSKTWRIYTKDSNYPPLFLGERAKIINSIANSGSFIYGTVEKSVLFENVEVGSDSDVVQSIIHSGAKIGRNVYLQRVIVMENTIIPDGVRLAVAPNEDPLIINEEIVKERIAVTGGNSV